MCETGTQTGRQTVSDTLQLQLTLSLPSQPQTPSKDDDGHDHDENTNKLQNWTFIFLNVYINFFLFNIQHYIL